MFFAAWLVAGTAQAAVLYQPAFTVISRWYGPARVRPLTVLTLVAGFASTIFAPLTAALTSAFGWRGAFIILAGIMGIITVPLHARYLNRNWAPAAPGTLATDHRAMTRAVRRSPEFLGLQALMVLLCLGLYTVTLNIIPLLVEKGADYRHGRARSRSRGRRSGRRPAAVRGHPGRRPAAGHHRNGGLRRLPARCTARPGAGADRGGNARRRGPRCQTLLQATIVADRWGTQNLGTLQGLFAAPLTAVTAVAPAAGPRAGSLATARTRAWRTP